ncbi:glycosyltransferase [Arthrobacter oryzae]|uniref:glycosyltransferase n=1 Tax=Arthrobacter oryzae TaxID=409290 RepID=UPI002789852C|nr:glycosyltransferase [Arthrobacter oryzae]MDQ0076041.1 glycosyltransferase involved in cell wall biosynthesis [Arthrobacter oryzae]
MIILIPAYEPDQQLPALVRSIRDAEPWATVVVVDDGSGPAYRDVFDGVRALGCHLIGYTRNRGKGFALKTGFWLHRGPPARPGRGLRRQRRPAHHRGHPSRGGRGQE